MAPHPSLFGLSFSLLLKSWFFGDGGGRFVPGGGGDGNAMLTSGGGGSGGGGGGGGGRGGDVSALTSGVDDMGAAVSPLSLVVETPPTRSLQFS